MARARLLITAISQVDLSTPTAGTNVVAGQQVQIYEINGTTPLVQSMYAAVSGGSPISNPLTADSSGNIQAFTPYAQRVKYKAVVNGVSTGSAFDASFDPPPDTIEAGTAGKGVRVDATNGTTNTGNLAISGPRPWVDPFFYGAVGDTTRLTGGAITAGANVLDFTTFPSLPGNFTAASVGKTITVLGAGPAGAVLNTQIASFVNVNTVTLVAAASTTLPSNAIVYWGTDDTAAIQAAIAAVIAAGGGRVYLRHGFYLVSGALAIYPGSGTNIVEFFGDGCESTQIVQITPNTDVIAWGRTGGFGGCQHPYVHDLTTWQGRYGVSLNNTSFSRIERVRTVGATVGIYAMGTNEHIYWEHLTIESCSGGGMLAGASNGGTVDADGLPYFAKGIINHVEFNQISGGPALKLTAGIQPSSSAQLESSGGIEVSNIVMEQCTNHGIVAEHCIAMRLCNIANESSGGTLEADNTYSVMQIGKTNAGASDFVVRNLSLSPVYGARKFKYTIEVLGGCNLDLADALIAINGSAGTHDFHAASGTYGSLKNVSVTGVSTVSTANVGDFFMDNVLVGSAPITTWAAGTPWIARSTTGIRTGNLGVGTDPLSAPLQVAGSALLKTTTSTDFSFTMDTGKSDGQGLHVWSRSAAVKWQHGMSVDATPNFDVTGPSAVKSMSLSGTTGIPTFGAGAIIGTGSATMTKVGTNTTTWDPPNLVSGAVTTTPITVTGALLGDHVLASFSLDLQALSLIAYVSSADTVQFVLTNNTAGAVNLGSGTVRATILRVA